MYVKYQQTRHQDLFFVNYSKQIFACNDLPRVYDLSPGFWSRWILLEFPYEFIDSKDFNDCPDKSNKKVKDVNIIDKLTTDEELSGLLNKALDGLDRLFINKSFSYSIGASHVKNFWIRKSDSFTAFCLDNLSEDIEGYVTKKDLRKSFVKYCKTHSVKGASEKNIKTVLEDMFGVIESKKGSTYESQERVWEGIVFKNRQDRHGFSQSTEKKNSYASQETMPILPIDKFNDKNEQNSDKNG